jgi:hypothetical protein
VQIFIFSYSIVAKKLIIFVYVNVGFATWLLGKGVLYIELEEDQKELQLQLNNMLLHQNY